MNLTAEQFLLTMQYLGRIRCHIVAGYLGDGPNKAAVAIVENSLLQVRRQYVSALKNAEVAK